MVLSPIIIEDLVKTALKEDLGHGFDITSNLLIPAGQSARGVLKARQDGRLAGLILALSTFSLTDIDFDMSVMAEDGADLQAGDVIAEIEGPARSLLTAERVALNFMSHMSGVATLTARYVEKVKDTGVEICDTRKTLPGLRLLQKYAVEIGGGANHRFGLDDAILIKDNHIAAVGSIDEALNQAHMLAGHTKKIEIEVDTLAQLEDVLANGKADIVMLDNFGLEDLKKAVQLCKGQITTEASGSVNLETVRAIAETGVDYISVGALTHSAPTLDIALDIDV
ncbi:MAG: carboxylating nicotinate-nucleotide diphosphorylase [Rhodospirillales bacterium]|nr:carboxylating nicotinate-nucleotide diphosphorylase [Alphaproteobacteria bacterium]MCB9981986.1 carboxylating nicotinate-nucleotide diphosphorylase [Rhodospirillales bacterium]